MPSLRCCSSLLAAAAAVVLATGVAGATALSVSETTFRSVFSTLTFTNGLGNVSCPVTLQGVIDRNLEKVSGGASGAITESTLGACTQGSATLLGETLPWDLTYSSFAGSLPRIERVVLATTGFADRVSLLGLSCLYGATASSPASLTATRSTVTGQITGIAVGGSLALSSGMLCPATQSLSGSGTATVKNAGTALVMSLIAAEASEPLRVDPLYGYIKSADELTPSISVTNKRTTGPIEIARGGVSVSPETLFRLYSDTCEDGRIDPRAAGCVVGAQYIGGARNRPSLGRLIIEYRFGGQNFSKVLELIAAR